MIGVNSPNPEDRLKVLKLFLKNGQDVNAIGQSGQSILIRLVAYRERELIQHLLDHVRIDLNIKMTEGRTIENVTTYEDDTAVDIAKREEMNDIVAVFEEVVTDTKPSFNYLF